MAEQNTNGGVTWPEVAKASAERQANDEPPKKKRGRPKKGEQTRLPIAGADEVRVKKDIEIAREMTDPEWDEQSALLASHRLEQMAIDDEIKQVRDKHADRKKELKGLVDTGARQVRARRWFALTPCIEVHNPNTRTVHTFADVDGEPGAEVMPDRPMTADEYERAVKGSPFDPPLTPPDGEPVEAP